MQSEDIKELATALAKAQGEIEGARKDTANEFFGSKYADLSAVWDACREPLTKNGLSVYQHPRTFDGQMRLVTRVMHESGQWLEDDGFPLLLVKQDMQGLGSATTYARRFGLMAAVGIAPEDDDGNAASDGKKAKPVEGKGRQPAAKPEGEQRADAFVSELAGILKDCKTLDDIDDLLGEKEAGLKYLHDNFPTHYAEWKQALEVARAERHPINA